MSPKPSRQDIHDDLREAILLLDLPPGTHLREEHLAKRFGVSRTPIRQVLDRLEFEGLVDISPRTGARVSALDSMTLRDIWAVRLRLAEIVGDFVVLPARPETLQRVAEIRNELEGVRSSRDLRKLGALYNRFHEAMLEVVANRALVQIHDLMYVQTARVWMRFMPEMDLDLEIDVMAEEVDAVAEALRDSSGAELSRIRAGHMRRLLDRFNDQVTKVKEVPA